LENGVLRKAERFEVHHRILVFSIILVGTVILTRFFVIFYNPNPVIINFELHHFDYGILLILISTKLLLFGPKKYGFVYLLLTAVASGLIIDEYWFIRRSVVGDVTEQTLLYNSTFPSVLVLVLVLILVVLFINSIRKSNKKT